MLTINFLCILEKMDFDTWFDFFGFITQILYDLSPILFIILLKSEKFNNESLSCISLLALYINALIYFFLNVFNGNDNDKGIVPRDYCNLVGTYLGIIYLGLYFHQIYKSSIKKLIVIYILILSLSGLIVLIEWLAKISNYNEVFLKILDWVGVIFNIFEYFPIGFNIIFFIKNKTSEKVILITAIIGLINTFIWIGWGIYTTINDNPKYHSIVANCIGTCVLISQLIIVFKFNKEDNGRVSAIENTNYEEKSDNDENDI